MSADSLDFLDCEPRVARADVNRELEPRFRFAPLMEQQVVVRRNERRRHVGVRQSPDAEQIACDENA